MENRNDDDDSFEHAIQEGLRLQSEQALFQKVTWSLDFADSTLNKHYYVFKVCTSTVSMKGIAVFFTLLLGIYWILVFFSYNSSILRLIASLSFIFFVGFIWTLIYLRSVIPFKR